MNYYGNSIASESNIVGNAQGDFSRAPPGPSMTARPGDAPGGSYIVTNDNGDFVRVPPGASMTVRPGDAPVGTSIASNAHGDFGRLPPRPNSSNVPATTPNGWAHQHQSTTGLNSFQIFVNSFTDNRNHTFEVRAIDTVRKLKGMIREKLGVIEDQQRLIYAGKNLEDNKTLSDYDIRKQSTVHLTGGRLRGG